MQQKEYNLLEERFAKLDSQTNQIKKEKTLLSAEIATKNKELSEANHTNSTLKTSVKYK